MAGTFFGVTSMIAGVVVLAWPFDSILVLAIVAGAWLVVLGIMQIVTAFTARQDVNALNKGISQAVGGAPSKAA